MQITLHSLSKMNAATVKICVKSSPQPAVIANGAPLGRFEFGFSATVAEKTAF